MILADCLKYVVFHVIWRVLLAVEMITVVCVQNLWYSVSEPYYFRSSHIYSTVALVPPMSTMDVWRGIT